MHWPELGSQVADWQELAVLREERVLCWHIAIFGRGLNLGFSACHGQPL